MASALETALLLPNKSPLRILFPFACVRAMKINDDMTNGDIEAAMNWLDGLIGAPLDRSVANGERHGASNPLLASYFQEKLALETALVKARRYSRNTGSLPFGPEYDLAYYFAVNAHRIHSALPNDVREPFSGRLKDAVNSLHGAQPFAFEIGMAVHVMGRGWDVDFADYSGTGRFDFLARRQDVEIEMEVKSPSGDAGRKIHRKEMNRLADLMVPTTEQLANEQGCHLLRVTVSDRLPAGEKELMEISALVAKAAEGKSTVSTDLGRAEYGASNISDWPDPRSGNEAREFFEELFGVSNQHILFYGRGRFSIVAVLVESSFPNQVLQVHKALANQAKKAADQCTGKRPAVIALQIADPIDAAVLEILRSTQSGLHFIASKVFEGFNRLHVDSVVFAVPQLPGPQVGGTRQASGLVVTLFNPNPLYPCPAARTLFSSS
jgi:hypothetical protein